MGAEGARDSGGRRSGMHVPSFSGLIVVLGIRPFRRLWLVLSLSALGDWLGLLGTAAFASAQVTGSAAKGLAFGSVIAVQLLPALILGPIAGVFADRWDRRLTMSIIDALRFLLYASIPTVGLVAGSPAEAVGWAAIALFLAQAAALLWMPAKEAAVPNLLPRSRLETANQLTLLSTYGITPVLAAAVLAIVSRLPFRGGFSPIDLVLYFDALTFLASSLVVFFGIREISGRTGAAQRRHNSVVRDFIEGWHQVRRNRLVRGLVTGILAAFAGCGVVIGTVRFYSASLGGGDATFAVLFAVVFIGIGFGIVAGPLVVGSLSRRRWFGLSIMLAGASLMVFAFAPRLGPATVPTLLVGAGCGMAFLSGITLLGGEVDDSVRGRVFAFVQTAVRVTLILTIAVSGIAAGAGSSRHVNLGLFGFDVSTTRIMLLVAGAAGVYLGVVAFRQMDDRPGVPVLADIWASIRGRTVEYRSPVRRR